MPLRVLFLQSEFIILNTIISRSDNINIYKIMDPNQQGKTVPFEYICPITHYIMIDPVITTDGHTFERQAIQKWFNKNQTNPLTNKFVASTALIPNRSIKNLISSYSMKASGQEIQSVNKNMKSIYQSIYHQLSAKFPELVDDFGMADVAKIEKILKMNEKLKKQNTQLIKKIQQFREKSNFYFPKYCTKGQLDFVALAQVLKQQRTLLQKNEQLQQKISLLKQQLIAQQQQNKIILNLISASHQQQISNITQPWYDSAAQSLSQLSIPPSALFIHITEVPHIYINTIEYQMPQVYRTQYKYENVVEVYGDDRQCNVVMDVQLQCWGYFQSNGVVIQMYAIAQLELLCCYFQNVCCCLSRGISSSMQKIFAKSIAESKLLGQVQQITLKIHHDLFDGNELTPVIDALNNLPQLKQLTVIVDPLFTIFQKNWTNHIKKGVIVRVLVN